MAETISGSLAAAIEKKGTVFLEYGYVCSILSCMSIHLRFSHDRRIVGREMPDRTVEFLDKSALQTLFNGFIKKHVDVDYVWFEYQEVYSFDGKFEGVFITFYD